MKKTLKKVMIPDLQGVTVHQSNRVTNAKVDYTLIQHKVFTWIMYQLQGAIKELMNGKALHQLDLFSQQQPTTIIAIPLQVIGRSDQYNDIRDAAISMGAIPIQIMAPDRGMIRTAFLFSSIETPDHTSKVRSNVMHVEMREDVLQLLLEVDKNIHGRVSQYTSFKLHVAMQAKCKYTSRIYTKLCSWKERKQYTVSMDDLRDHLQIGEKNYTNYSDFRRYVLDPVAKELRETADLWFDPNHPKFKQMDGKKVVGVSFQIEEPGDAEKRKRDITNCWWLINTNFSLNNTQRKHVMSIFTDAVDIKKILDCVERCHIRHLQGGVKDRNIYLVRALQNEFGADQL